MKRIGSSRNFMQRIGHTRLQDLELSTAEDSSDLAMHAVSKGLYAADEEDW